MRRVFCSSSSLCFYCFASSLPLFFFSAHPHLFQRLIRSPACASHRSCASEPRLRCAQHAGESPTTAPLPLSILCPPLGLIMMNCILASEPLRLTRLRPWRITPCTYLISHAHLRMSRYVSRISWDGSGAISPIPESGTMKKKKKANMEADPVLIQKR